MKYELREIDSVTKVLVPVADEPEPRGKKKKEEPDNGRDPKKPL
jgi:hypothetical protein